MRIEAISILLLAVMGSMLVAPVLAGPTKSQGDNVVFVDPFYCIFTKSGWRQWADRNGDGVIDEYANVLYTQGMNSEAIAAKLADGWSGPYTIPSGDIRYPYINGEKGL